jgi:putative nucleotidyltransferase with HDIG domain
VDLTSINFFSIIPAMAIVLYTALYILVSLSHPQNKTRKRFRWYLLSMVIWSLGALIVLLNIGNTTFWFRLMSSGAILSMVALFFFTQSVVSHPLKSWANVIYVFGFIAFWINLLTNVVTPYAAIIDGELTYELRPWIILLATPGYLVVILSIIQLFYSAKASEDETNISRYVLLIIAIIIVLLGAVFNFTDLGKYPLDIAANVVAALLISYAILRHQLLDIQVVLRRGLLYFIPTIIIGAAYFLLISLTLFLIDADTQAELFTISLIVSIIAGIVIQPLRDLLQRWVDRFFFRERYSEIQMLQRITEAAASLIDIDLLSSMILNEVSETIHIKETALFLRSENHKSYYLNALTGITLSPRTKISDDNPIIKRLTEKDDVITRQSLETDPFFKSMWRDERKILDEMAIELIIPLKSAGELLGLIMLGRKLSDQGYSNQDRNILFTLAQQTAVAVNNAQLYSLAQRELLQRRETEKRLQLQLRRLSALQDINIAITTNIDLQIPLYLLLEQVTDELKVDAADVLLLDEETQQLVFVAGQGFRTEALKYTKLDIGAGLAGRAAETAEMVRVKNLNQENTSLEQSPRFEEEGFVSYFGVPLISKGLVKGVLELFHRSPLDPNADWMDFLGTLTSETAIAVDNAQLFRDLEKSNMDLSVAYETTLEGWARTLELKDRETEGHSQRVVDLTMRLCKKLGVSDDDLEHVRRGALLHDIGKMGVPDSILLKPGALNDEEWKVMKMHPIFAKEMLLSIPFLKPATDIPYCHHEKWDGSGYPQGIKGEEIPLPARIFAIVDVWDALRSERPYRPAWSDEKAIEEIKRCKGTHFDPVVVEAFLDLLNIEKRKSRSKK